MREDEDATFYRMAASPTKTKRRLTADEHDDIDAHDTRPAKHWKLTDVHGADNLSTSCPYVSTVNRRALDFDLTPICSVTLSQHNVYCCLVCGHYFTGRGAATPAYHHSIETGHCVYVRVDNGRFYCLPDLYEILDPSLNNIRDNLHPRYTDADIAAISSDRRPISARSIDDSEFIVGLMGLNNVKRNDWLNVIVQSLQRVTPLRDYLLSSLSQSTNSDRQPLVSMLASLAGRLWNVKSFKSHVSPHSLIQTLHTLSNRSMALGQHTDPLTALSFILNTAHRELTGGRKDALSIVSKCFQGEVLIETLKSNNGGDENTVIAGECAKIVASSARTPFYYLSLKLPSSPLFADHDHKTIIPTVPLATLLTDKFGSTDSVTNKRFSLLSLPLYLIVHYQRFATNQFTVEKNRTLVTFPMKGLNLSHYVNRNYWESLSVKELVDNAKRRGLPVSGSERQELIDSVSGSFGEYELVANVVHHGPDVFSGHYSVHVLHCGQWYELRDLSVVTSETTLQLVQLSQAYIQIYRRRDK